MSTLGKSRFNTDELYKLVCTHEERLALSMNQAFPEQEKTFPRPLVLNASDLKEIFNSTSIED